MFMGMVDPNWWLEFGKLFGIPGLVLAGIFFLAFWWMRNMSPTWTRREESVIKLNDALAEKLPEIAKSTEEIAGRTEETLKEISKLHRRHDETQQLVRGNRNDS